MTRTCRSSALSTRRLVLKGHLPSDRTVARDSALAMSRRAHGVGFGLGLGRCNDQRHQELLLIGARMDFRGWLWPSRNPWVAEKREKRGPIPHAE